MKRNRLYLKSKFPATDRTYCNVCMRLISDIGGDHYYMVGDIKPRPFLCRECYEIHSELGRLIREKSIDASNGLHIPPLSEMN